MTAISTDNGTGPEYFEEQRPHLRAVAYRMLGSLSEAEDAVQETWLRLNRSDASAVRDLRAWLTTVVSRVCLDMLRSRAARREDSLEDEHVHVPDPIVTRAVDTLAGDPQEHAVLADSIGLALLVVLDTLSPSERLAFVLHDIFALPFEDIGQILDRSPAAAKQLASRARRRLRDAGSIEADGSTDAEPGDAAEAGLASLAGRRNPGAVTDLQRQHRVVEAFLAASREGDFDRLLTILDPDVVLRADAGTGPAGPSQIVRGAHAVIAQAKRFAPLGRYGRRVMVNGTPGFMVVTDGKPFAIISMTVSGDRVTEMDILADPERLARLDLSDVLDD